jgi:capsular polysaccharide biosynthesis protein
MIVKRNLPKNYSQNDGEYFSHELQKELKDPKNSILKSVFINFQGYIFNFWGVKKEVSLNSLPFLYFLVPKQFLSFLLGKIKIKRKETTIWFTDKWSDSYFHWFCDSLPRLMIAFEKLEQRKATLILPRKLFTKGFIQESLHLLDIAEIEIIEENEIIYSKTLVISELTAPTGNFNPLIINRLRDMFQKKLLCNTQTNKVYISRGKSSKRRILNESEVIEILAKKGFGIYYFEELSCEEQATLCFNATHIMSNHGAGLTNILFMKKGGKVFEFRHENDTINNCYFSLASALELDYYYQICETTNEMTNIADMRVDIDEFKIQLDIFIQKR